VTPLILDASVLLKWFFPDETLQKEALKLQKQWYDEKVQVHAPALLSYEICNGIQIARRRGRITRIEAEELLASFCALHILYYHALEILPHALKMAEEYGVSTYDATYVALAEVLEIPFVTADERLAKKLASLPRVYHLSRFSL